MARQGADSPARTILLHAEQGLGDSTIQFVRYAPGFSPQRGAQVVLEKVHGRSWCSFCPAPAQSGRWWRGTRHCRISTFIVRCMEPAARLRDRVSTTIPAEIPYVAPAADEHCACGERGWPRRRPPRSGSPGPARVRTTTTSTVRLRLGHLAPLLDLPEVTFVSLQHEVREEDMAYLESRKNIVRLAPALRDFADTAAVVAALDAVISVDTAVAHLAGAMGKPLFLMLPFAADFRWLRERRDSPWYPSARLFRQPAFGDWNGAVGILARELAGFGRDPEVR